MNSLRHFPIGTRYPDSVHSVCCSLPTLAVVKGYEEKRPDIMAKVKTGYPRFVFHDYVVRVGRAIAEKLRAGSDGVYPVSSPGGARSMADRLAHRGASRGECDGMPYVRVPGNGHADQAAKAWLQHTGCSASSRQAEDWLVKQGLLDTFQDESIYEGADPERHVQDVMVEVLCGNVVHEDIVLCRSGMNAFYAAYSAINSLQQPKGKDIWVQLGWLYLDTTRILEKFGTGESDPVFLYDVFDRETLENLFREKGDRIAGVITEAPTNPLLQTADLVRLRQLTADHGAALVIDPTLASPANIDVLPYADLVVNSLTKYAANEADVMAGALILNRDSEFHSELRSLLTAAVDRSYAKDMARLAHEIDDYLPMVETTNRNAMALARFLEDHPAIRKLYWPYADETGAMFERFQRAPASPGCVMTVSLKGPLADFYDAARIYKSPSFGAKFSMMCPFMYLAHYDLVSEAGGRRELWKHGLDPDLVRISVGAEPVDEIIAAFDEALR